MRENEAPTRADIQKLLAQAPLPRGSAGAGNRPVDREERNFARRRNVEDALKDLHSDDRDKILADLMSYPEWEDDA